MSSSLTPTFVVDSYLSTSRSTTKADFRHLTPDQVTLLLERYGHPANGKLVHNKAPNVEEFFLLSQSYKNLLFSGYVILRPESNWGIYLDGFSCTKLDEVTANELLKKFPSAEKYSTLDGSIMVEQHWK